MVELKDLYGWLLARQPPGLRALGRFWGAVGLTLGVGTAVLGYLGPPKTVAILTPDVSTTLALDHAAASKSEIAMAEPSSIAITEAAASSARRSVPPSPAPENTAGPMVWPSIPGFAGVASDPQQSVPAGSPRSRRRLVQHGAGCRGTTAATPLYRRARDRATGKLGW